MPSLLPLGLVPLCRCMTQHFDQLLQPRSIQRDADVRVDTHCFDCPQRYFLLLGRPQDERRRSMSQRDDALLRAPVRARGQFLTIMLVTSTGRS